VPDVKVLKTLYLLRHAMAEPGQTTGQDFDRALSEKGREEAALVGDALGKSAPIPAQIRCSAALRAVETWQILAPRLGRDRAEATPEEICRDLYLIAWRPLLRLLRKLPDGLPSVLVIGHNPGLQQLAVRLSDSASIEGRTKLIRLDYPTAGLAILDFDPPRWAELSPGSGRLRQFLTPANLRAGK
jgi:phosphohistidine phosphatase